MSRARAVSFEYCKKPNCTFKDPTEKHLIVSTRLVDLQKDNAIAISYAWGEFDREERWLGHFEDMETSATMELGEEWDLDELRCALQMLCQSDDKENPQRLGALWIDQFCISQNDPQEIGAALAKVPEIFKTFNVVALLAGGACECWPRRAILAKSAASSKASETEQLQLVDDLNDTACINDLGLYPWVHRLWPRQEILYAESIRVVWTKPGLLRCPNSFERDSKGELRIGDIMHKSSKAIFQWYARFKKEGLLLYQMQAEAFKVSRGLLFTLTDWVTIKTYIVSTSAGEALHRLFDFMLGDTLDVQRWPDSRSEAQSADIDIRNNWELRRFLYQLSRVTRIPRKATKQRDYVLSIWVDCPGYRVPCGFQNMTARDLLKDALQQFMDNHQIVIATHAPMGLFGIGGRDSHFWAPNIDQSSESVESVVDFYASMPIKPANTTFQDHLSSHAGENDFANAEKLAFTVSAVQSTLYECFHWMIEAVSTFTPPLAFHEDLEDYIANSKGLVVHHSSCVLLDLLTIAADANQLMKGYGMKAVVRQDIRNWLGDATPEDPVRAYLAAFALVAEVEETIHLDEVARMAICCVLRINYRTVVEEGMQLLIQKTPPMLGLCRGDFRVDDRETFMRAFMTVPTWGDTPALVHQMRIFERQDGLSLSEVVGVWVPVNLNATDVRRQLDSRPTQKQPQKPWRMAS